MANEALIWVSKRYDGLCHPTSREPKIRQSKPLATVDAGTFRAQKARRRLRESREGQAFRHACRPSPQSPQRQAHSSLTASCPERCLAVSKSPQNPLPLSSAVKACLRTYQTPAIEGMRFTALLASMSARLTNNCCPMQAFVVAQFEFPHCDCSNFRNFRNFQLQ